MRAIASGVLAAVLAAGLCAPGLSRSALASGYEDFNAGVAAKNRGEHDAAIAALTRALGAADLPQNLRAVAWYDLGEQNLKLDRIDDAIAAFTQALALKPRMLDAWLMRGLAHDGARAFAAAIADDGAAIALKPDYLPAWVQRAAVDVEQDHVSDAIADYSAMIGIEPGMAELYVRRANLHRYAGEDGEAVADASRALEIDSRGSGNLGAHEARALAYAARGDWGAALADESAAVALAPANPQAHFNAGLVAWDAGRYGDARASFARALALDASSPYSALWLALADARAGVGAPFAGRADPGEWPGPLLALYQGHTSVDEVRAAAAGGDADARRERACEADFYIGEWRLLHRAAGAAPDLQNAAALCPLQFPERAAATAELSRAP